MDAMDVAQNIGLHYPRKTKTPKDVEDRMYLQYAVDKAGLNVSERLAINEFFYPNGGGFDLFQKGQENAEAVIYFNEENPLSDPKDTFTKELTQIKPPKGVKYKIKTVKTLGDNFTENFSKAISKLREIVKMDK